MSDVGGFDVKLDAREAPCQKCGASMPQMPYARHMPNMALRAYSAPVLVALDLRSTHGDDGVPPDGADGSLFTSGGGPQ